LTNYLEALEIRRKLAKERPLVYLKGVVLILRGMGLIYTKTYRFNTAVSHLKEALEIIRKLAEKNPLHLPEEAATLVDLGMAYNSTSEFREALSSCEAAMEIYERLLVRGNPGKYDLDVCRIMIFKCGIYAKLIRNEPKKSYKEAGLELAKQAVSILRKYKTSPRIEKYMKYAKSWKKHFKRVSAKI
jgi:tetratricopeptide (TPR) repeat protein